ncbi:hypothetical protein HOLleu_12378 [Holothuria leucospilota]|uniref:Uncharacterized protein n=1 Tax=Holothuria leucospilota TaxID=206669 RepID=A0A9Q1HDR3_HOLLE|nr:hypothetical protein HOLleu_12378 [Holothuria leucospilota]
MLGEEDMKQIIPKMGLRLKFIRHYRAQESFYCRGSKNGPAAGTLEDRISYLRRLSYAKEDVGLPKLKRIRDVQQKGKRDTRLALSLQVLVSVNTILKDANNQRLNQHHIHVYIADEKHNLAIHLLPYLFPGRRKGGRISAKQSSAAFVDFQCESTNLEFYLKNITEKPQPYVLILGGSRIDPQQVFVIIERHALPQTL